MDHAHRGGGFDLRDAGAAAQLSARSAAGGEHDHQRAGAAVGDSDSASVAVLGISQPAAVADIVSPVAQPGLQPPDSAAWQ